MPKLLLYLPTITLRSYVSTRPRKNYEMGSQESIGIRPDTGYEEVVSVAVAILHVRGIYIMSFRTRGSRIQASPNVNTR